MSFGRLSQQELTQLTGEEWAAAFLSFELQESVPEELIGQFEVARGALLYGWFFYPLYTLGQEQLYRVLDSALVHRCQQLGGPANKKFYKRLDWLGQHGSFSAEDKEWWRAIGDLRNIASHANSQRIGMPTEVVGQLRRAADRINGLFASDD